MGENCQAVLQKAEKTKQKSAGIRFGRSGAATPAAEESSPPQTSVQDVPGRVSRPLSPPGALDVGSLDLDTDLDKISLQADRPDSRITSEGPTRGPTRTESRLTEGLVGRPGTAPLVRASETPGDGTEHVPQ